MILAPGAGRIIYQDNIIRFEKVPLVTPNGDVLIQELNFEVKLVLLLLYKITRDLPSVHFVVLRTF